MRCREGEVNVTGLVRTRRNELGAKPRLVQILRQGCVVHRCGLAHQGGDIEDVVFADGVHAGKYIQGAPGGALPHAREKSPGPGRRSA